MQINISLVDDEALVNMLLSKYLNTQDSINVISVSNDGSEFIDLLKKSESLPDIVLLDLRMKVVNGIETIEYIKQYHPDIKIISLSSHYKESNLGYMVKTGVNAFLPKEISPEKLVEVIKEVYTKGFYFSIEQLDILRKQISKTVQAPVLSSVDSISDRELDVLKLICKQYTNSEIGEKLFISTRTVEGHRNNLYLKTGTKNIAGLIIYAVKNKLVDLEDCMIM
ncbi:MAG: response regulator transcription factor [Bacteroidales bacterium]|nr:response regulator transcription factor [Bacteroidales bacterium]